MAGPQRLTEVGNVFDLIGQGHMGKNLLAKADPALRARIQAAADAGDRMALLKILSENTNLTTAPKARSQDMPYDMPPASRDPVSFDERVARDPNINNAVSELGMQDAPVAQKLDAYRQIVEADGADNFIDRLASYTVRPEYSLDLLPNNRPLFSADTGLGGGGSAMDVMPGAAVPSSGGGLIVQGGRGVPVGGPTGSGVAVPQSTALSTQVTPRAALPGRGPRRLETTAGVPQGAVDPRRATAADATTRPVPRLESPDVVGERRAMERLEDAVEADAATARAARAEANRPGAAAERARKRASDIVRATAIPVAAGAAGVVLNSMRGPSMTESEASSAPRRAVPDVTRPPRAFSTADLAAETSPPPSVQTEGPAPLSPRNQAQELIRKLNLMRREAGGEVPEAPAMQREINRLMAMSNQTLAAASRGEVATGGGDYHMQAARLMAQLNDMRRRAGGEVPQARQMMAEITRLQRLGDEQRNARQAPRRAG